MLPAKYGGVTSALTGVPGQLCFRMTGLLTAVMNVILSICRHWGLANIRSVFERLTAAATWVPSA